MIICKCIIVSSLKFYCHRLGNDTGEAASAFSSSHCSTLCLGPQCLLCDQVQWDKTLTYVSEGSALTHQRRQEAVKVWNWWGAGSHASEKLPRADGVLFGFVCLTCSWGSPEGSPPWALHLTDQKTWWNCSLVGLLVPGGAAADPELL